MLNYLRNVYTLINTLIFGEKNIEFVSDDKCYINNKNKLTIGSPQAIRLDYNTLINIDKLKKCIFDERGYKLNIISGKIQIVPKDLCSILELNIIPKTTVKYGIILEMAPNKEFKFEEINDINKIISIIKINHDAIHPYWLFDFDESINKIDEKTINNIKWFICRGDALNKSNILNLINQLNELEMN